MEALQDCRMGENLAKIRRKTDGPPKLRENFKQTGKFVYTFISRVFRLSRQYLTLYIGPVRVDGAGWAGVIAAGRSSRWRRGCGPMKASTGAALILKLLMTRGPSCSRRRLFDCAETRA